jgi:nucleotide-binding universal stress UspA family protein
LLGSVSAEVAKHAACPVVVTRPTSPGALKDGVVVGADATAESVPVIEFAFQQASLHHLPLTVMHCVYDAVSAISGARGPVRDHTVVAERRMLIAESVAGLREKYPDVHVTTRLERGLAEECLVVGPRPWNLIVVGRHPVRPFRSSASTAVLERAHSAVAVVPEAAPSSGPR